MGLKDGSLEALKQKYAGQFIDYDDGRITEIVVGYALQAVVHAATGDPFCSNPTCRFHDAHYQSNLMCAQLQGGEFCQKHAALLEKLGAKPAARRWGLPGTIFGSGRREPGQFLMVGGTAAVEEVAGEEVAHIED